MILPPLPRIDDRNALGQLMRGPTEMSNWVIPGMLMCGCYPGAIDDRKNDQSLKQILRKGIDTFVCLQEELDEDLPEDVWRSGVGIRPYFADAQRLTKKELKWIQLPIADGEVAPDDVTAELVVLITENLRNGRAVYVHCWGGHGRAGVICCLLLSYLYRISAAESLKRVQAYHDCRMEPQGQKSPQTVSQREQVKRQVQELLRCQAPGVEVRQQAVRADIDVSKRGCMMPSKNSAQMASCPDLSGGGDTTEAEGRKKRPIRLKTVVHEKALPDYLELPQIMPGAASRREAIMRQKSLAAAMRRHRPGKAGYPGDDFLPLSALVV